jgi:GMP synthase-like glutamine amidotransferase
MEKLRIHYFQHVSFEGSGSIEEWASANGHSLTSTGFYKKFTLPDISDIDWLIIMGGPMSVNDEELIPWLSVEKQFIRQAIDAGKTVLGICLGSQLISSVLGARVYRNAEKEIGWFDIELTASALSGDLFFGLSKRINVFHWHGETFDLPENTVHLASSGGCKNQAYLYNRKVLALQFHIETNYQSLRQMIDHGRSELTAGRYVQPEQEILSDTYKTETNREILFLLLNRLAGQL